LGSSTGRVALEEAARQSRAAGSDLDLRWDTHSLAGFESSPIHQFAERCDVIVLDHPLLTNRHHPKESRPI